MSLIAELDTRADTDERVLPSVGLNSQPRPFLLPFSLVVDVGVAVVKLRPQSKGGSYTAGTFKIQCVWSEEIE
jgi:hypothetical protein